MSSNKKPPQDVSKEVMASMVSEDLTELRENAEKFTNLVNSIQQISRADVSLGTIETCKEVALQLAASKSKIDKIRKVMLLRARTRMRELERGMAK